MNDISGEGLLLKADFHVHSKYSRDCNMTLEQIIRKCQDKGINCIALTDHGSAEGALLLQQMAPFTVIVGEEVLTPYGEIMGLFLKETVPSGLSPLEAAARIKAQGGLVGVPHPFDSMRGLKMDSLESLVPQLDFLEVFNSRSIFRSNNSLAKRLVSQHGLLATAGSDAHTPGEIGKAYVEMQEFTGKEEFKKSLVQGKIIGRRSSPLVHVSTTMANIKQHFKR
jgi:predicted metal-dependent phosphoesterase TrpH